MNENLLQGSDKQYWHRYLPLYEEELSKLKNCNSILEFGIFKGDSVRWLNSKYPDATIFACDILPVQPEWPIAENINYFHVDQGKINTIKTLFSNINKPLDLIIEDGSHFPEHQKNCLVESVKHMSPGGIYILEDLHTSHPEHNYYKKEGSNYFGPLHLVLFLEHYKSIGRELNPDEVKDFTKKSFFSTEKKSLFSIEEIVDLFNRIAEIKIYKRTTLPHKCYACGSIDFQYHLLKCKCGVDIYSNSDSMTAIIRLK